MSRTAKFVKEISVEDPETGGTVHMAVYKHQNGGMFAMDSSFINQVPEEGEEIEGYDPENELGFSSRCSIYDPFATLGEPEELFLEED
jgi:hypothetical protein